jgi:hypothetical protein
MSDYLSYLIARSTGEASDIRPRLPSRFEQLSPGTTLPEIQTDSADVPDYDAPRPARSIARERLSAGTPPEAQRRSEPSQRSLAERTSSEYRGVLMDAEAYVEPDRPERHFSLSRRHLHQ